MSLQCTCSSCARSFRVADASAGKRVKCPQGGAAVPVPPAPAEDEDGQAYGVKPSEACPRCGRVLEEGKDRCGECGFNRKKGKREAAPVEPGEFPIGTKRLAIKIVRDAKGRLTLIRNPGCLFFFLRKNVNLNGYNGITVSWKPSGLTTVELTGPGRSPVAVWWSAEEGYDDEEGGMKSEDLKSRVINDLKAATGFQIMSGRGN